MILSKWDFESRGNFIGDLPAIWDMGLWGSGSRTDMWEDAKDNINCPEKVMKSNHFNHIFDKTLLLFSRPMRNKDTSALREMFQYSSLDLLPLYQYKIATH